ncbi:MAG: quinolinate synthase NadA [Pirellulales bacterium]|nr:quinolinate synthase NadA [Pirellulales bacterium]
MLNNRGIFFVTTVAKPTFDLASYESLKHAVLAERIQRVRAEMGPRLLILGHHYQQDEVIDLADLRGDSYGLSERAANNEECRAIVFCGVHFMAETADILANRPERLAERGGLRVPVILPDLEAGCSLADMADVEQVEKCWAELAETIDVDDVTPITYVNSTAELKAFCGRRGGIVCTSANARAALDWAFQRRGRVLFFPDQHLGRNTARAMGIPLEQMPLWDPRQQKLGGNSAEAIRDSRVILWRGFCCVHQQFTPYDVAHFRTKYPGIKIIVHPEYMMEVADLANVAGSTSKIIREIEQSPPGTRWAIGTEQHLVDRLCREHTEQEIHLLSTESCVCSTMSLINLPRLCWAVENLAAGTPANVIEVEPETARWALEALKRMLEVK